MEFIRTYPAGPAQYCSIPYSPDNIAAKKLYETIKYRSCKLITLLQTQDLITKSF